MRKTIFKLLALTLALLMLLPLAIACKKKEEQQGTASSVSTGAEEFLVKPQDLGGKVFDFATSLWPGKDGNFYTPLSVIDLAVEATNGDFVNDAAYERNLYMQEMFNCTVKQIDLKPNEVTTKLQQNAMAGDDAFEFVVMRGTQYVGSINGGYLADASKIGLNFGNTWWDSKAIDAMTINGRCFGIIGDVTTNHLLATYMTVFNKAHIADYKFENPHDLVKNNKWTFAKMIEMSRAFALQGSSTRDENAFWGINYTNDNVPGVLTACGVKCIEKVVGTGEYNLVFPDYQSNVQDILTDLFDTSHSAQTIKGKILNASDADTEFFDKGKVLFVITATHNANALRASEIDYGIVPYPKLTEEGSYITSTAGNYTTVLGVPLSTTELDKCAVFLEAYAEQGQKRVRPQLYENVLLRKVGGRDNESYDMLTYIYENLTYDVGYVFDLVAPDIRKWAANGSTDVSSIVTTNLFTWTMDLDELLFAFSDEKAAMDAAS